MDVNLRTTLFGKVGYTSNTDKNVNKTKKSSSASSASYVSSFDKASFSTNSVSDDSFASMLASKTAASMKSGVSASRVAELKAQVQSGTYNVDSTRIAERMLGYRG